MEQRIDLDLLFLSRTRSKEPKSLWPLSNRSDLESSVIATHIELILIVTGAATATMLTQFFAPLPVLRLIYGEAPTDRISVALARHWGLLIFCVGALLIYAVYPTLSRPPCFGGCALRVISLIGPWLAASDGPPKSIGPKSNRRACQPSV